MPDIKNVIYCDDNIKRLAQLPSDSIDLIYLDPPFFSNRNYEVIWGDEAEVRSFKDRWEGGMYHYIGWMRDRLVEMHRVLRPKGTIYLHCDWHASHYLKVEMDQIFGYRNFLNEIAWCYDTGGRATSSFPRKHDTILRYGRHRKPPFYYDQIALPRDPTTMHETIVIDELGKPYQRNIKAGKEYRYYLDKGVLPNDWWTDIQALNPAAKERLGYPTQKPETLLKRIIGASTKKGDTVLDPFCGCGTTVAVAASMGRNWIGIDISPTAISIIQARMAKLGIHDIPTIGMPVGEQELRELGHYAFQNWVIQRINGTHSPRKTGDMGIDGYSFMEHHPVQVKQSSNVGRNVVDNFETAIRRAGRPKGFIVAFSFTRGAREEVARARDDGLEIQLVTVSQLLGNKSDLRPAAEQMIADLMPSPRKADSLPSADDLIRSASRVRAA